MLTPLIIPLTIPLGGFSDYTHESTFAFSSLHPSHEGLTVF